MAYESAALPTELHRHGQGLLDEVNRNNSRSRVEVSTDRRSKTCLFGRKILRFYAHPTQLSMYIWPHDCIPLRFPVEHF